MADTLKVLGQVQLAVDDTEEQLYKVPSSTSTTISSIVVGNRGTTDINLVIASDVGDGNGGQAQPRIFYIKM